MSATARNKGLERSRRNRGCGSAKNQYRPHLPWEGTLCLIGRPREVDGESSPGGPHTESVPPASSVRGRQGSPHLGRMPSPRQCGPMGHPRMTAATPCVLHLFHHQGAERSVTLVPCRVSAIHLEPLGPSRPRRRYCTPDFATAGGSAPYIGVPLFQLGACFQPGRDGTASCP